MNTVTCITESQLFQNFGHLPLVLKKENHVKRGSPFILSNIYNSSSSECLLITNKYIYIIKVKLSFIVQQPGRVAQSVGHLTCKSGVLGSIPGLATYFRFSFRFFKKFRGPGFDRSGNILSFLLPLFQEGQLSVTGESMCMKYWLTA